MSQGLTARMQRLEARVDDHATQLDDQGRRLAGVESKCAAFETRFTDSAYELELLMRITLRNARRLDRLDHAEALPDEPKP